MCVTPPFTATRFKLCDDQSVSPMMLLLLFEEAMLKERAKLPERVQPSLDALLAGAVAFMDKVEDECPGLRDKDCWGQAALKAAPGMAAVARDALRAGRAAVSAGLRRTPAEESRRAEAAQAREETAREHNIRMERAVLQKLENSPNQARRLAAALVQAQGISNDCRILADMYIPAIDDAHKMQLAGVSAHSLVSGIVADLYRHRCLL